MASDKLSGQAEIMIPCIFEECDEEILIPVSFQLDRISWGVPGSGNAEGTLVPDYQGLLEHVAEHINRGVGALTLRR